MEHKEFTAADLAGKVDRLRVDAVEQWLELARVEAGLASDSLAGLRFGEAAAHFSRAERLATMASESSRWGKIIDEQLRMGTEVEPCP